MKQSDTKTIIGALQALAHDIVTDDGVINACLIEAAERLQSLSAVVERAMQRDTEIQQTLGKALGYPWFKDDQKNFPGSTHEHGVCVGDHVAESLADEAAEVIERLRAERRWIPVEERLPKPGVEVVAYIAKYNQKEIAWRDIDSGDWMSYAALGNVTHWMPLPAPPEKEVQG